MNDSTGKLVIISAPSGTGKGTVINELLKQRPDFVFSVSATTREPRPGEDNGVDYHFITKQRFKEMIDSDEFLEYAEYVGEYYGTPATPVEKSIDSGVTILLDVEVQGAKQVMKKRNDAISIFITPPDMQELENRLRGRGTDSEEKLTARLKRAQLELEEKSNYNHIVVNDDAFRAAHEILSIIDNYDRKDQ